MRLLRNDFGLLKHLRPYPSRIAWSLLIVLLILTQQNCGPGFVTDEPSLVAGGQLGNDGNNPQASNPTGNGHPENVLLPSSTPVPDPTSPPPSPPNPVLPVPQVCTPQAIRECTIAHGQGRQTCNAQGTAWGNCQVESCNTGYSFNGSNCVPSNCSNGATNPPSCNSCASGQYFDGSRCLSQACSPDSVRSCSMPNGQGQQTCNAQGTAWSSCQVTTCNDGYQPQGNQCVQVRCTNNATNFPACNQCASDRIWVDDGCRTLSEISHPCPESAYGGFQCYQKKFTISSGYSYQVLLRWNRHNQSSQGTVIWVSGGDGSRAWRTLYAPQAASVQDDWEKAGYRSVELQFLDVGGQQDLNNGYWRYAGGYLRAGELYFEVLKFINQYLKSGSFLNHIGISNGSMVAATAMAYFGADQYLNRVIFHAGPFLPDVKKACRSDHFASFALLGGKRELWFNYLSFWSSGSGAMNPCQALPQNLSILAGNAKTLYPRTAVHTMMGALEATQGFSEWIYHSHESWYQQIVAAEKTYLFNPSLGHEMDWNEVRNHGLKSAPSALPPDIKFYFTDVRNGSIEVRQIRAHQPIHAVVTGLSSGEEAAACWAENVNYEEYCGNPRNWISLPHPDWSYQNGRWLASWDRADRIGVAGKMYTGAWIRKRTGQKSLFSLQILPP